MWKILNTDGIAKEIGVSYGTARRMLKANKFNTRRVPGSKSLYEVDVERLEAIKGERREKKKKCKDCKYRTHFKNFNKWGCGYILITQEPRGCTVEDCNKYVKG